MTSRLPPPVYTFSSPLESLQSSSRWVSQVRNPKFEIDLCLLPAATWILSAFCSVVRCRLSVFHWDCLLPAATCLLLQPPEQPYPRTVEPSNALCSHMLPAAPCQLNSSFSLSTVLDISRSTLALLNAVCYKPFKSHGYPR